jgi:hypothetical protein
MNWKVHKALAFIGMGFVGLVLFGVNGMTMNDRLFDIISFKWLALIAQAYASWVWYSLVKI